ncbi:MAG: hydroxymethylglutaryl-CoA reductase [Lactobacillus sp.]|nr:hydroxymethylglutaryl-CoA reductase [Lactobacillus sp.]MDN6042566.1 hydroxymethylglutaryl-CoA reductase [Lactobacillus sp.]MDN6052104.1 hydroxymethylglutaryl-CoA reductase [Lactobacillus sp.]
MKFYQLTAEQRRAKLAADGVQLLPVDPKTLAGLEQLSENVIGGLTLPLGLIPRFIIQGRPYRVPLATEEASVVAAANHGASCFNQAGGVQTSSLRRGLIGQLILAVTPAFKLANLTTQLPRLKLAANQSFLRLIAHGGGIKHLSARQVERIVYVEALVDPAEAMGANKVNSILEFLGKQLQSFPGVSERLAAILSNAPSQFASAKVVLPLALVSGTATAKRLAQLSQVGQQDARRGVTNNKGIMNGVDAALLAFGQDFRAVEAACGMQARRTGAYRSLSRWQVIDNQLVGELTLPLATGVVGGSLASRPEVRQNLAMAGIKTAQELAEVIVSVGLASNFAALLALSTDGIQHGHMKLQTRQLVAGLAASPSEQQAVLQVLLARQSYGLAEAEAILTELREKNEHRN